MPSPKAVVKYKVRVWVNTPPEAVHAAPVFDACGRAGGTDPTQKGPGEAVFATTEFAAFGDLGSEVLKAAPSGTVWTAGATVEVSWGIRYNHGGGKWTQIANATCV